MNLAASGNIVSDKAQKLKMSISEIPSAHFSWSDWWIRTNGGLFRFVGPELQFRRGRTLSAADGIPAKVHSSPLVAEDPFGKLWLTYSEGLYRLDLTRKERPVSEHIPVNVPLTKCLLSDERSKWGTLAGRVSIISLA